MNGVDAFFMMVGFIAAAVLVVICIAVAFGVLNFEIYRIEEFIEEFRDSDED